jgi:2-polyprenyl-3-methyl-5-hydroxy-6-metoxy-1,4-benzoquinol methylase
MADLKRLLDVLLVRKGHVCPWWLCFTFDNPLRKLIHDPRKILAPYVQPGAMVVDIGPGMGYFTIPLCRLVGDGGRVVAVDIERKMLRAIERRAERAGVSARLTTRLSPPEGMWLDLEADFVLAFWMAHEVPDKDRFFREIHSLLKPNGLCLLAEPKLHVSREAFAATVESAAKAGLMIKEEPIVALSRAVLFSPAGD